MRLTLCTTGARGVSCAAGTTTPAGYSGAWAAEPNSDDFQKYVQRTLQVLETSSMKFCHILTANGM